MEYFNVRIGSDNRSSKPGLYFWDNDMSHRPAGKNVLRYVRKRLCREKYIALCNLEEIEMRLETISR